MLERNLELARQRRYRAMVLDVARNNPDAQRLYGRFGFRTIELRRSTLGKGAQRVPDHYRMRLDLA